MFWCRSTTGGCEWLDGNLYEFANAYNVANGTDYRLVSCLDKEVTGEQAPKKQPEILLKDASCEKPLVVERKVIVWPEKYLLHHELEHQLWDLLSKGLDENYKSGLYKFCIDEKVVHKHNQQGLKLFAEEILKKIRSQGVPAQGKGWTFRKCGPFEEEHVNKGIIYTIIGKGLSWLDNPEDLPDKEDELAKIRAVVEKQLLRAADKFPAYQHATKIVVFEFFGETSSCSEEDEISVIRRAKLPPLVDEVWLAQPDWVSEDEFEKKYIRVA